MEITTKALALPVPLCGKEHEERREKIGTTENVNS
jgi:hypothetical protein